jgi:7 transmembrane sweet-taste receptor of 3 GCPR
MRMKVRVAPSSGLSTSFFLRTTALLWLCCCCAPWRSAMAQGQQQRQLVVTLPLHDSSGDSSSSTKTTTTATVGISHAAAVMMALQHASVGYGGVVEQLSECNSSSSSWNVTFLDSASSTAGLLSILGEQGRQVDALVGGYPTAATFRSDEPSLVDVASQLQKPLILYGGGSERSLASPMVTRVFPSVTAYGRAIVDYLVTVLNRTDYYGIVVEQTSGTALQYMQVLLGILSSNSNYPTTNTNNDQQQQPIEHQLFTFQMRGDQTTLIDCFEEVKRSGYRTLLFLLDDEMYPEQLAAMAKTLALADSPVDRRDFLWVLVGNLDLAYFETAPAEVLDFAQGAFLVTPVERFMWVANETFPKAWNRTVSNDNVAALQQLLPTVTIPDDYYTTTPAQAGSGFIYDAVASLLLATTCQSDGSGTVSDADIATRVQESDFRGASGLVIFDRLLEGNGAVYPGARVDSSATFGAYNVMPNGSLPLVATRGAANSSSASSNPATWKAIPNATILYSSGTTVPPPLRGETDQNLLTPAARTWGFVLFGLLLLFLAFCAVWLVWKRDTQTVRSSQPAFLGLLLLGSLSVSFCIVTDSFDEGAGWSEEQLSMSCTATPWLLVCGVQLIYSSIFCKLMRIDKVLQFRRRKVTIGQVVWPMATIFVTVLVLLTAWTALGGFDWVRTVLDPFTGESTGQCQGEDTVAWFVPILLLMVAVVLLTAFLVYKTRDIDSMYSETSLISAMILFQVQMLLVTIPLLMLVSSMDTVTRYIVRVAIFFLLSASSAGFLIVPRVWRYYFPKNDGPKRGSRRGTTVSGVSRPAVGSSYAVASTDPTRSGSSGEGEVKGRAVGSDTSNSGDVFKNDIDHSSSHRSLSANPGEDSEGTNHQSNGRVSFAVPRDIKEGTNENLQGSSCSALSFADQKSDEAARQEIQC